MPSDSETRSGPLPDHHDPGGGFRNPWPTFGRRGNALRWALQRITGKLPSDPDPDEIPRVRPTVGGRSGGSETQPARAPGEIRATWIGHATFLLEIGGLRLLTDPHWSDRASPVSWAGPKRLAPPGVPFEDLPPIDAVLLSHDHLDHLDEGSVRALARRHGTELQWCTPLGYAPLLRKWGVARVSELDWYDSIRLGSEKNVEAIFLPAQHWSARSPFTRNRRLWGSWAIRKVGEPESIQKDESAAREAGSSQRNEAPEQGKEDVSNAGSRNGARSVYFGGDSGWFPEYPEIGRHAGPFDMVILPIGAYAPRWFMKPVHMNPAEAVRSYRDLGGRGILAGMHWGTFRLSDEHPLEPPRLLREAWREAGLPEADLWIPALGETRRVTE